jgi:hypothetical protein
MSCQSRAPTQSLKAILKEDDSSTFKRLNFVRSSYRRTPTVSRFRNIKIEMFFHDHNPPHFHARTGRVQGAMSS